jgi:sugar O-acyltransferase (sialic acid O-acetyltransferase NeuD family)
MKNFKLNSGRVLILGGGGHAASIINVLKGRGCQLLGYTDLVDCGNICGVPYLGDDHVIEQEFPDANLIIGVTYTETAKDLSLRFQLIERYCHDFNFPVVVSKTAIVADDVLIEEGSAVMHRAVIGPRVTLGAYVLINTSAVIEHDCRIGDRVVVSSGVTVGGGVVIGVKTFIGLGAVIIDGVEIGDDCIIAAGAVVTCSVPDGMIALGVPAKVEPR